MELNILMVAKLGIVARNYCKHIARITIYELKELNEESLEIHNPIIYFKRCNKICTNFFLKNFKRRNTFLFENTRKFSYLTYRINLINLYLLNMIPHR
jgi:hypothetical protein